MTRRQRTALELLAQRPAGAYGLDLVKASKGTLHRGSVYVVLAALQDRGLVMRMMEVQRPELPARARFFLTEAGRAELRGLDANAR
jgi:DNA-binding PadR family transcriptional regulator